MGAVGPDQGAHNVGGPNSWFMHGRFMNLIVTQRKMWERSPN
jgi:hypothetical protein